jgi:hypothetical protein
MASSKKGAQIGTKVFEEGCTILDLNAKAT